MEQTSRQGVGITVTDSGVTFCVWAPFADSVAVTGDFNDWNETGTSLTRDGDYWVDTLANAKIGQEYKYVISRGGITKKKNDPRALQISGQGNSIIVDPHFDWEGDNFTLGQVNDQVIYELHIGTFHRTDPATSGTFDSAIEKLPHLAELGITAIELMPCNEVSTDRWWGYTPNLIYAIEHTYGGRQAFMRFIREAHKHNIGVILDVVYNHLHPDPLPDLWQFDGWSENNMGGIYFYNDERGMNQWGFCFDFGRPEVRSYLLDNAAMWIRDCHVDGLRADSTVYIRNSKGQNNDPAHDIPEGWMLLQNLTKTVHTLNPHAIVIAEDIGWNEYITKPVTEQGAGFDAQWETSLPYAIRDPLLDPIDDNNRNLDLLRQHIEKTYNGNPFQKVIYSESHDIDANGRTRLNEEIAPGQANSIFARRRATLGAAITMTIPGIPMLFQGQEFLEDGAFNHWEQLDWKKAEEFHGTLQLYKDLIALRRDLTGLTAGLRGSFVQVLHLDQGTKVMAYYRKDKGGPRDDVVVALNFTNEPRIGYQIPFPRPGTWKVRLNSDWQGYSEDYTNMITPDVQVEKDVGTINVAPYSVVIFSQDD